MNEISFFCIGAQKAGTSTLHDILVQNPDIYLPDVKETHFFRDDEKYNLGRAHYFKKYFSARESDFLGEIDPEYSYFTECAQRIKETLGDSIKFLFILRNPVDRAYSHYLMTKRRGYEELGFIEALEKENSRLCNHWGRIHHSYISRGIYSTQINRYTKLFGKNNLKIILFEDLIKDMEGTVNSISKFIGLPPYEYDFDLKSNIASEPKSILLRNFIFKPNYIKKLLGKMIWSEELKANIITSLNRKNLKPVKNSLLSNNQKKLVHDLYFSDEINLLEKIVGRSLQHWRYE
ncbi:sulfotransferase [Muricauda sp. CAU 1633]|uniref:sulfotransferase family protein n=1 Tax=Allomuricauda sp. CAU 1633 TaxID=2816036 RepID=UPI001A8FD923|nr:sulfotransferase [Muricauda sp. CAU 1633]MBO0320980.1 sulfotransferase [Muricauda sp. CAU 1633]